MQKISKQHPTDQEIIELYWNKDERAIAETERKYGRFLYKIAYGILKNKSDCEECQNDTYLRAWNAIPPEKPATLRLFLAKIMRGVALNSYAAGSCQRRVPSHLIDDVDDISYRLSDEASVDEEVAAAELGRQINAFLKTLESKQQQIFVGRFYFGESAKEIAKALQMTRSNVYKQLERIKSDLKKYLNERGEKID